MRPGIGHLQVLVILQYYHGWRNDGLIGIPTLVTYVWYYDMMSGWARESDR
jgi:hypothetical protein